MARTSLSGVGAVDYLHFYHSVLTKAKLRRLPAETYRCWTLLLICASSRRTRGTLPGPEDLAFATGYPDDELDSHLAILIDKHLIERSPDGALSVAKWHEYQPLSGTERSRKSRTNNPKKRAAKPAQEAQADEKSVADRCMQRDATKCNEQRERESAPTELVASIHSESQPQAPPAAPPPPPAGGGAVGDVAGAVRLVREVLGREAANAIEVQDAEVDRAVNGRWDCFAAAVRAAARSTRTIKNVRTYLIATTRQFAATGIPPDPVALEKQADPAAAVPFNGRHKVPLPERIRRAEAAEARRRAEEGASP